MILPMAYPPTLHGRYSQAYGPTNVQARPWIVPVDPTLSPVTQYLEQFKDWSPERLRDLLERRAPAFESHHDKDGLRVHDMFQSDLQSHVFHDMPIRVINSSQYASGIVPSEFLPQHRTRRASFSARHYMRARAQARSSLRIDLETDPTPSPATLHLDQLKDWGPEQLRDLLERQVPSRDSVFEPHHNKDGLRVHDVLQSELQSHVFHNMPIRVIKLPEMELMERSAVASYLTKTHVENGGYLEIDRLTAANTGKELQGGTISQWLQGIARFAILSHTWWQEEEPSYKTFKKQRERWKGKRTTRGYRKLQQFCNIAYSDYGVEFAWADTVCIDKSSSVELDESIRSMFAWYRNSAVCIAYLAETTDLLNCASDRWFSRGWTLQEILAPHRLKFYNKDWYPLTNFLSDKLEYVGDGRLRYAGQIDSQDASYLHQFHLLQHAIFMATGLDMATICKFRPGIHAPSLPERMKWVARRVTTRAEDKAYCMMGIFGVSISIAYGEGAERAFFRLFTAILEVGYSRDWFVWGGKPISWEIHPSRMIPSSPECYLSREEIEKSDLMSINAREGELVTLTNLGLPMKMLVVPARVSYNQDLSTFYRPTNIRISCPLSDESVVVQGTASDWDGESQGMVMGPQFALGVLNIVDPEIIDIPSRLCAILLRRPVQELRWTAEAKWTYSKWEKWETNKALVFRCNTSFTKMDASGWDGMHISRSDVGWSEKGDEPRIRLQMLYL